MQPIRLEWRPKFPSTLAVVELRYHKSVPYTPYTPTSIFVKNLRNQGTTHFRRYGKIALTASWSGRSVRRNNPKLFGSGAHSKRGEAGGGGCQTVAPSPQIRN
jgi:hypothetical protein